MSINRFFKPRFLLLYPVVVWLLVSARPAELQLHAGIALACLGVLLRSWANGYVGHVKVNGTKRWRGEAKIGRLVTAGPYAFIRHPLYLGSFLLGAGLFVTAGNLWLSLAALGFFLTVYRKKVIQEETLLRDEIGEPYAAYHAAVPRWLPTWRRYPHRQGAWRWQGLAVSREWKTAIWVTVLFTALYFREEIREQRLILHGRWEPKHVALLVLMGLLIMWDGLVEVMRRLPSTGRAAASQ